MWVLTWFLTCACSPLPPRTAGKPSCSVPAAELPRGRLPQRRCWRILSDLHMDPAVQLFQTYHVPCEGNLLLLELRNTRESHVPCAPFIFLTYNSADSWRAKGSRKRRSNSVNAPLLSKMSGYHLRVWFCLLYMYLTTLSMQCRETFPQETFLIPVPPILWFTLVKPSP